MFAEEQFLRKKFGDVYLQWSQGVPAFLPNFSNFISSNFPFSWKKVLKKEKNGLAALFLIFCLFDVSVMAFFGILGVVGWKRVLVKICSLLSPRRAAYSKLPK